MSEIIKAINHPEFVPDKKWKKWTDEKLPSSDCNWITDIDSFIRTRNGCVALIELKRKGSDIPIWQKMSYGLLAAVLEASEGKTFTSKYLPYPVYMRCFKGMYEVVFENTWFDDGKTFLSKDGADPKEVSEDQLQEILSFENSIDCFPLTCDCHKE